MAERLLTPEQAAEQLALRPQTLARWRCEGQGPVFIRLGRSVRYRQSDLDAWIAQGAMRHTSLAVGSPA
jgi:excisionase family DNA binding protein